MKINTERLIETFFKLVQIDSPSGFEKDISKYVYNKLNELNLKTYIDSFGNVIGKISGNSHDTIMLSAHLDTVEPGRNIIPTLDKGIIKSSGSTILGADNKAGVAVILEVLEVLYESNIKDHKNLEVVFTTSEEVANLGALNLDYTSLDSKVAFTFDSGSPVGTITVASPFYNSFDMQIIGKTSHAAHPEMGISALNILNLALNEFKFGRIDEETVCNVGVISGGQVRNSVIGEIKLMGEVRSFNEITLEEITSEIQKTFKNSANEFECDIYYKVIRENGGFKLEETDPLVISATQYLENIGIAPKFKVSTGCYDANIFFDHGIKTLNFGNGSRNNHTVDEQIDVSDLYKLSLLALEIVR